MTLHNSHVQKYYRFMAWLAESTESHWAEFHFINMYNKEIRNREKSRDESEDSSR